MSLHEITFLNEIFVCDDLRIKLNIVQYSNVVFFYVCTLENQTFDEK